MRNITKSFIKGVFGKKIESLVYHQAFLWNSVNIHKNSVKRKKQRRRNFAKEISTNNFQKYTHHKILK